MLYWESSRRHQFAETQSLARGLRPSLLPQAWAAGEQAWLSNDRHSVQPLGWSPPLRQEVATCLLPQPGKTVVFSFCEIPRPPLWVKGTSLLRDLDTLLAGSTVCPYLIFLNKTVKLLNAAMEYFLWGELLNLQKDWCQSLGSALSSRIYSKL